MKQQLKPDAGQNRWGNKHTRTKHNCGGLWPTPSRPTATQINHAASNTTRLGNNNEFVKT
eukprot:9678527-Lingulodinium_polyedra.AAC.1